MQWRMSPTRVLPVISGVTSGLPMARATASPTWLTVFSSPPPMLNTSPSAAGLLQGQGEGSATSLTWTKSRRCSPSSNTMGRWPLAMREEKMASTPV